ncbi:MAG: hypothetical protein JNL21_40580 [Myxococcales bacterium]|nr:hypothetical protein [Myxococcales bacterium]
MPTKLPLAPDASPQETSWAARAPSSNTPLAPLYAGWIADLVDELPTEPHATCDACVMTTPVDGAGVGLVRFDEQTKCCTYQPALPSFLAGRILRDRSLEARFAGDVIRARIAAREGVGPLGLDAPGALRDRYAQVSRDGAFGRAPDLRCPHFRAGPELNCGIWRHRNATCSTWFCKHDRGGRGAETWRRLRDLLALAEARLARWCALELELTAESLAHLIPTTDAAGERSTTDRLDADARYRAIWGDWVGHEEAFFAACAERVERLRWSDVEAICGSDASIGAKIFRAALAAHDAERELPSRLRLGLVETAPLDDNTVLVRGYSEYDPLVLPQRLLDALSRFDGQPTEVALDQLRASGVELDRELLLALLDFEVLVGC